MRLALSIALLAALVVLPGCASSKGEAPAQECGAGLELRDGVCAPVVAPPDTCGPSFT